MNFRDSLVKIRRPVISIILIIIIYNSLLFLIINLSPIEIHPSFSLQVSNKIAFPSNVNITDIESYSNGYIVQSVNNIYTNFTYLSRNFQIQWVNSIKNNGTPSIYSISNNLILIYNSHQFYIIDNNGELTKTFQLNSTHTITDVNYTLEGNNNIGYILGKRLLVFEVEKENYNNTQNYSLILHELDLDTFKYERHILINNLDFEDIPYSNSSRPNYSIILNYFNYQTSKFAIDRSYLLNNTLQHQILFYEYYATFGELIRLGSSFYNQTCTQFCNHIILDDRGTVVSYNFTFSAEYNQSNLIISNFGNILLNKTWNFEILSLLPTKDSMGDFIIPFYGQYRLLENKKLVNHGFILLLSTIGSKSSIDTYNMTSFGYLSSNIDYLYIASPTKLLLSIRNLNNLSNYTLVELNFRLKNIESFIVIYSILSLFLSNLIILILTIVYNIVSNYRNKKLEKNNLQINDKNKL